MSNRSFKAKIFNAKTRRRKGRKGFMFGVNLVDSLCSRPNFSLRSLHLRVFALDFISTEAAAYG